MSSSESEKKQMQEETKAKGTRNPEVSKYSGKPLPLLLKAVIGNTKSKKVGLIVRGIQETLCDMSGTVRQKLDRLAYQVPSTLPSLRMMLIDLGQALEDMYQNPQSCMGALTRIEFSILSDLGQIHNDIYQKGYQDGYKKALQARRSISGDDPLSRL